MTRNNQTEHLRYRYGMCLNDACSKAKAKEVQQIAARKEFVCEECGKPLRECPPPRKGNGKRNILIAVIVIALCGIGYGVYVSLGSDENARPMAEQPVAPEVSEDSVMVPPTVDETSEAPVPETEGESATPKVMNGRGTVDLGYGTYTGDLKNGKPHGYGIITYKTSHKIVSSKDYVAQPGDTFEGEFREGRISGLGYWKHDGNETAVKP